MATLAANWTPVNDISVQQFENLNSSPSAVLLAPQMHSNRQPSSSSASSTPSPSTPDSSSHPPTNPQQQSHPPHPQHQQQQQSTWTPSPMAAPFYPQFPSYFVPPNSHVSPHGYYDPQQQFAQWAVYQPMLFNGQQQQFAHNDFQRNRTPSGASQRSSPQINPAMQPDFYQQPYPFPTNGSNTPPIQPQNPNYYQGFHPYRRPNQPRQNNPRNNTNDSSQFHPPYANHTNSTSSSSVNSASGSTKGSVQHSTPSAQQQSSQPRQRISSNNSSRPSERTTSSGHASITNGHSDAVRVTNPRPASTRSASTSSSVATPPHPAPTATPSTPTPRRPTKPSPLSQDSTVEDKVSRRLSRDDSDLAYATGSLSGSSSHVTRTGGLKGRLRRALAINNASESKPPSTSRASGSNGASSSKADVPRSESPQPTLASQSDLASGSKPKSKPIFNLKFNASTDNISLSSTVSSASVMIRKIGSMGKIARRSSIAGITRLFKDKDRKKKGEFDDETDSGRGSKSTAAETTVTTATAELDRMSSGMDDVQGLSPAAQLVRQHTMKSKAQEDARLQAQAAQRRAQDHPNDEAMPVTWDRGTAKRGASGGRTPIVNENGTHIFDEEEDSYSGSDDDDNVTFRGHDQRLPETLTSVPEHIDDEDEDFQGEDVTIRMGDLDLQGQLQPVEEYYGDVSAWDVPRPNHQLKPAKGILRNASSYNQERHMEGTHNPAIQPRVRANSYTGGGSGETGGPGPLADIPSQNPDHIDGLHKTEHQRSSSDSSNRLPDFSFEAGISNQLLSDVEVDAALGSLNGGGERSVFSNPALNSSAPVLSTMSSNASGPPLVARSAPTRHISFAATLSIYDTFAATIYDRRCEPVTCNRLTPALAQRIKEELNTYKMEEMEVHAASRVHTHFFV